MTSGWRRNRLIISKFCNMNEISPLSNAFAGACVDRRTICSDRIDYPCGESGSGNRDYPHGLRCTAAIGTSDLEAYIHIIRLWCVYDESVLKVLSGYGDNFCERTFQYFNNGFFRRSDGCRIMIPANLYLVRPCRDGQPYRRLTTCQHFRRCGFR